MAKAVRIHRQGGPEVMQVRGCSRSATPLDRAHPPHGDRGNFVDIYQRSGLYPMQVPATAGNEGAGVVEAVGPGGDRR